MSKTEVSGKQIKDGTIEQVDLSATLSGDITQLKSDVATLQTDVAGKASSAGLAAVATSGAYSDLSGTPSLSAVATSGSYNDLADKPSIPSITGLASETYVDTAVAGKADSASLAPVATSGAYADLTGKPSLFDGAYSSLTGAPSLATVATTGSYNDLADKPSIPSISGLATETYVDTAVAGKADSSSLATVATSGSYNDLTNKPSIPSITGLASETYVDTKVADLVASAPATLDTLNELAAALGDDASFSTTVTNAIAAKANSADLATVATSGAYADLTGKPSLFDGAYSSLTGAPSLATVATSGSYNDLADKPTFSSNLDGLTDVTITSASNGQVLQYNGTAWVNGAAPSSFSGSYTDLTDKPTIPSALDDLSDVAITSASKGQFVVHNGTSFVNSNTIEASGAAVKPLIVKGAASQTAVLFEAQNSAGTAVAQLWPSGALTLSSSLSLVGGINFGPASSGMALTTNGSYNGVALGRGTSVGESGLALGSYVSAGANSMVIGWGGGGTGRAIYGLSSGEVGIGTASPGAQLHLVTKATTMKGLIVQGIASQTANLFEVQNSSNTILASVAVDGSLNAKRFIESVANAFNTSLAPSSGTLTVDTSLGNAVLGALSASVTTWAFTNVPTDNSRATTVVAVIAGNASYTYGDACSVNGSSVSGGIMWSGGSAPTATAGTDIISFIIVRDSAGTIKVFGSATTNFS